MPTPPSPFNTLRFQEHRTLESLVALLIDQPEEVLVNVVGALGEFAQIPANKVTICRSGGIKSLINLLTGTNQARPIAFRAASTKPSSS